METLILKQPRLNFNKGQGEEEADFTLPQSQEELFQYDHMQSITAIIYAKRFIVLLIK